MNCQKRDNLTKLENMKNGQIPKSKKNLSNLVVSKPEHHNFRRETAIKTNFEFSRKKEHSLIADTKLPVDKNETKMEAKFNKPFSIWKSNILKVQNKV